MHAMMKRNSTRATGIRLTVSAAALAVALIAAGCSKTQAVRGYVPDDELLAQLQPGQQTRDQVAQILGSPSSISTFEERNDTWYYITRRTEQFAFFDEEVLDQRVVAIDFDEDGRVQEVRRFGLEDGQEVNPVDRKTPTRGRELGFFEQLFGNIGRFTPQ